MFPPLFYLLPEVARGAYFHWRDVFLAMKYFFRMSLPLALEVCNRLFIDSFGFMAVDKIKNHLLGLTQSNILTLALISE